MNFQIIIIIIAFLLTIIDKITDKPDQKQKGIKKFFNIRTIVIALLFILFSIQIIDSFIQSQKDDIQEKKLTETNTKVKESQELIDSVLKNGLIQIKTTEKEIKLISDLNIDLKEARKNISKNLSEYEKINLLYSQQIDLEKKKILSAQPDIRISRPITLSDSMGYSGQYRLINVGQRTADSIKYFSFMVLVNSKNNLIELTNLKTNINDQNILSLSPDVDQIHYTNYHICSKKDVDNYGVGYLIIKYSYYDLMMDSTNISPVYIYQCSDLKQFNTQYAFNVPQAMADKIKVYIKDKHPKIYNLFW